MLFRIRAHIASDALPVLQLTPKLNDESGELATTKKRLKELQELGYNTTAILHTERDDGELAGASAMPQAGTGI
jgi:hypothetical protein